MIAPLELRRVSRIEGSRNTRGRSLIGWFIRRLTLGLISGGKISISESF